VGNTGWKVLLKILITGATGAVAYLLTNMTHQPQIWSLTMSVFIGGVALVVQFLVDVDNRMTALSQHVDRRFVQISQATELFGQLEASTLRTDPMVALVQHAARIDLAKDSLRTRLVQSMVHDMSEFFEQIVDLRAEYRGGEHDWLFALVQNAKVSVKATSTIGPKGTALVDEEFWTSQEARAYLAHQKDAVQRGVKIRRIFLLYDDSLVGSPALQSIVQDNVDVGVKVRVLPPSLLPSAAARPLDFVLFDDEISYELSSASLPQGGSIVHRTALELRTELVLDRKAKFEEMWNAVQRRRGRSVLRLRR
jgi:hypothetical protein